MARTPARRPLNGAKAPEPPRMIRNEDDLAHAVEALLAPPEVQAEARAEAMLGEAVRAWCGT